MKLLVMATVMESTSAQEQYIVEGGPFDSDSRLVGVDNRCSGCITHVRSDITGDLKMSNRVIKGYGGVRQFAVWTGTIKWSWEDDQGMEHTFHIPEGKVRLLSPQHWAQTWS